MDEEKTIDEAVEQADEMKEFEPVAFDEVIKDEPAKAPVLRDAPEPADMNMIHKHVDNFLAKIAGETPIDENVRDSTEYWLNRIAESGGGGGGGGLAKKLHFIYATGGSRVVYVIVPSDSETPVTTISELIKFLYDNSYVVGHPLPVMGQVPGSTKVITCIYAYTETQGYFYEGGDAFVLDTYFTAVSDLVL